MLFNALKKFQVRSNATSLTFRTIEHEETLNERAQCSISSNFDEVENEEFIVLEPQPLEKL